MFTNLLESRGKKPKSAGGTLVSLGAHAAIIVVAIQATLHAGQPIEPPPDKVVFAAQPADKPLVPKRTKQNKDIAPTPSGPLSLNIVVNVPDQLPDVELSRRATNDVDSFGKVPPYERGTGILGAVPARADGRKVKQQVQQPFVFTIVK